jgi:hypothetical protein
MAKKPPPLPWHPADYTEADIFAVQAWAAGIASKEQQQRAFQWVTQKACRVADLPWFPGALEGQRATDFANGRKFAGHQVLKLLALRPNATPKPE